MMTDASAIANNTTSEYVASLNGDACRNLPNDDISSASSLEDDDDVDVWGKVIDFEIVLLFS
jgi:hypothetical protein